MSPQFLSSVSELSEQNSASWGRFIPRYFILFDGMVNGILSLNSLYGISLLPYRMQQISMY